MSGKPCCPSVSREGLPCQLQAGHSGRHWAIVRRETLEWGQDRLWWTVAAVCGGILMSWMLFMLCGCASITTPKPCGCCERCAPIIKEMPCPPATTITALPPVMPIPTRPIVTSNDKTITPEQWAGAVVDDLWRCLDALDTAILNALANNGGRPAEPTPTPTPGRNAK